MNVTETFRGFSAQRSLSRGGERTELHALTLPLDVERTETVRPGPNGRAAEAPVGDGCGPRDMLGRAVTQARGSADHPGAASERCARDLRPTGATPGAARACQTAEEMRTLRRNR